MYLSVTSSCITRFLGSKDNESLLEPEFPDNVGKYLREYRKALFEQEMNAIFNNRLVLIHTTIVINLSQFETVIEKIVYFIPGVKSVASR